MAEELKRHGITFSLDLNKHPKDATNLSLINAENFKVSEDGASLVADRNLLENETIKNTLDEYYSKYDDLSEGVSYKIINCIPSNDEIVLFVENTKLLMGEDQLIIKSENSEDNFTYSKLINIFRYNEKIDICKNVPILNEISKHIDNDTSSLNNGTFTYRLNDKTDENFYILIDNGEVYIQLLGVLDNDSSYDFDTTILHIPFISVDELYCNENTISNYYEDIGIQITYPYKTGIELIEHDKYYSFRVYTERDNIKEYDKVYYKINNGGFAFITVTNISARLNKLFLTTKEFINYYGGKFSGTFTYNVKNELIIAFCEYDSVLLTEFECGEPMKIINLGYWENNLEEENVDNWILINNNNLDPRTFPICPEVSIPEINTWEIKHGLSKKGWYHFYIRYKIDNYNYTQWFDFGRAFYLDEVKDKILFNYKSVVSDKDDATSSGDPGYWKVKTKCSSDEDICNKTIKFELNNLCNIYKHYQIGFICSTKIYNECKITSDIDIEKNLFELIYSDCTSYDINKLITNYNNYYNVKNIINYNNRLYISNYKLNNLISTIPNNINVAHTFTPINKTDDTQIKIIFNGKEKLININNGKIKLKDLFNVDYLFTYKNKIKRHDRRIGLIFDDDYEAFNNIVSYQTYYHASLPFKDLINNKSVKYVIQLTKVGTLTGTLVSKNFNIKNTNQNKAEKYIADHYCKRICVYWNEYTEVDNVSDIEFDVDISNNKLKLQLNLLNNKNLLGVNNVINTPDFVEYGTINDSYQIINDKELKFEDLNNSFTLIPRQPYCFYIHYVDKYGYITNGLPIKNAQYEKQYYASKSDEPIDNFDTIQLEYYKYNNKIYQYVGVFYKSKIITAGGIDYPFYYYRFIVMAPINKPYYNNDDILLYWTHDRHRASTGNPQNKSEFIHLDDADNITIAAEDGSNSYIFKNLKEHFLNTYGGIKDYMSTEYSLAETEMLRLFKFGKSNILSYGYLENGEYYIMTNNTENTCKLTFNNVIIPEDYVSYFISYEKLNKTQIFNVIKKEVEAINDIYPAKKLFFSDALNYRDNINLNIDIDEHNYEIDSVKYNVANSYEDDNFGISSNFDITYKSSDIVKDSNYLYKYPINIYKSVNKSLIRITEITNFNSVDTSTYGFYSYNIPIISHVPYRINSSNKLIKYDNPSKLLNGCPIYINDNFEKQFSYIPDESKQLNNPPKIYKTIINNVKFDEPTAKFYDSYLFLPQDTIDLFKNNALDYDESVLSIYINYNENDINQTDFIKTIRRSTYIKDESLENGWRTFASEAYQNIQENKGEIVRIEGIGDLLLVHTKDSLFQFDKSNLLMTANKNVQLAQGDTFDVGYKEIFTSTNGFGGLQDREAAIIGEFGYIWYNNDFNKIYQYDAGSLNVISGNIEFLLNKYKPTKCKFIDDKYNKRLLIQFQLNNNNQVLNLTYNYDIKAFISFYINKSSEPNLINETYNTKTKFYILENNKIFNGFDKPNGKKLSFIINENYTKIKRLNYIKYKLYKRIDSSNNNFNADLPVEGMNFASHIIENINCKVPYSGYKLKVYNDLCETELLDITADLNNKNPEKPYYDLGNFTFNNLRDKTTDNQIFGNFFIVEFTFEDDQEDVIEFESLEYGINYEEN